VVDFEVVSEGCVSTIGELHGQIRLGARLLGGGVVCGVDVVGDRSIVVVGDGGIVSDAGTALFGCEGARGYTGRPCSSMSLMVGCVAKGSRIRHGLGVVAALKGAGVVEGRIERGATVSRGRGAAVSRGRGYESVGRSGGGAKVALPLL
jgi:hypothetical protein